MMLLQGFYKHCVLIQGQGLLYWSLSVTDAALQSITASVSSEGWLCIQTAITRESRDTVPTHLTWHCAVAARRLQRLGSATH